MELSLRRWKPRQLLASWGVYWVGLIGVALGPAILAARRATRLPDGHGVIEAMFDNGVFRFSVVEEGVKTFAATAPFSTVLLWTVGPPLALWATWLMLRRRPNDSAAAPSALAEPRVERGALPAGHGPAEPWRVNHDDHASHASVDQKRTPRS
jgi:hypothetical protein